MKSTILFSLLFISNIFSQEFGISLGYSTSNAFLGDAFYINDKSSFHIGFSSESNDAVGKEVSEQKSNYGRTISGNGKYFSSFDVGFGYEVVEKVRLNIEISFASTNYYTNYVDRRFSGDGYHMITKDESEVGIGSFIGYNIDKFDFFVGYNSIRKMGFGLRYIFKR